MMNDDKENVIKIFTLAGIIIIAIFLIFILSGKLFAAPIKYNITCRQELIDKSREIAKANIGVHEVGFNDGTEVRAYLASVNLSHGNPYCQAFQYYCYLTACQTLGFPLSEIPLLQTGSTVIEFNYLVSKGDKVKYKAAIDDFIYWKHRGNGHVERIVAILSKVNVQTIGANTGSGNQREGDGVYYKKRNIRHPLSRLLLVRGLIGVKPI